MRTGKKITKMMQAGKVSIYRINFILGQNGLDIPHKKILKLQKCKNERHIGKKIDKLIKKGFINKELFLNGIKNNGNIFSKGEK